MSRVTRQPSNSQWEAGSDHSCQRRIEIGREPVLEKMSLPSGLKTLRIPRSASTTPGIVHIVKVLTTVSMVPASSGMRSPGRSR